jgi:hypothetical protein
MTRAKRDEMVIIGMGLLVLLESVRETETWWRVHGNDEGLQRTRELGQAVRATHQKLFAHVYRSENDVAKGLVVADGLRDAAIHCHEGQGALRERLIGGADIIERLCRSRAQL